MKKELSPTRIRIYGILSIIIGILFTLGSFWLMGELGGMFVIVLAVGPLAILIGAYQLITGKMLKK